MKALLLQSLYVLHICPFHETMLSLQWSYNERDGVSNHRRLDCLLNRLFRGGSKKISKFRVTGLWEGNPPVNSPYKGTVTRKMFAFDDVIMWYRSGCLKQLFIIALPYRDSAKGRHFSEPFEAETKWPTFSRRRFQMHFPEWKCINSNWYSTEVCP